ncbi:MAG: type II toxin-antitoxin system HicA family toxin [Nitrospirota bacterium]
MSGKDLVKRLVETGWKLDRISGSHHILKKEGKMISVPVHGAEDLKPGTLHKLLRQGGLK